MIKQIALPIAVIAIAAGTTLGATGAFFSDSETSMANTFTAGTLNLTMQDVVNGTAGQHVPFNITNMMPGDTGSKTVRIAATSDAWLKVALSAPVLTSTVDTTATPNLDTALEFDITLVDSTVPSSPVPIGTITNQTIPAAGLTVYSSQFGSDVYMSQGHTYDFVITYSLPETTGNTVQGDSIKLDATVSVQQYANNTAPTTTW